MGCGRSFLTEAGDIPRVVHVDPKDRRFTASVPVKHQPHSHQRGCSSGEIDEDAALRYYQNYGRTSADYEGAATMPQPTNFQYLRVGAEVAARQGQRP